MQNICLLHWDMIFKRAPIGALVAALLVLLSACDETLIDPFKAGDKYFTVYGFIDQLETRHSLRVIPVTRSGEVIRSPSDPDAKLDALVYTIDDLTGKRIRWDHHLIPFENGTYGHVFTADFVVFAQRKYRLEIIRGDGKMTTAETRVPYIPDPALFIRGPEVFSADSSTIHQDIRIPQIASPWGIQAVYGWRRGPDGRRVFVDYGRPGGPTDDGGWQLRLNISEDQISVRQDLEQAINDQLIRPTDLIWLASAGLQIRVLDQNWDPPDGIFDPEVLAQPGALSNVQNGYGLFGSIGLYIQEWNVEHLSMSLGYDL